jgi:ApaG protein
MTTQAVNIKVTSKYLGKQDKPKNTQVFVFSYTVDITNNSAEPVKLLSRYWLITNGDGEKVEVQGDGVIGEQPTIEPNQTYSYTSASMLKTEVGTMEGYYRFTRDTNFGNAEDMCNKSGAVLQSEFKAPIPVFSLAVPNSLH